MTTQAAVNKPYQNEIICWNNLIRYSFDFCIFRYFRGVSKIKGEMIMSKLRIWISSWWVVPFLGIRIKWFDGFGCFVFTDFIYKISKRRFVERWNASNNRYKFWTRNHLNFSLKRTPENFCVIWVIWGQSVDLTRFHIFVADTMMTQYINRFIIWQLFYHKFREWSWIIKPKIYYKPGSENPTASETRTPNGGPTVQA